MLGRSAGLTRVIRCIAVWGAGAGCCSDDGPGIPGHVQIFHNQFHLPDELFGILVCVGKVLLAGTESMAILKNALQPGEEFGFVFGHMGDQNLQNPLMRQNPAFEIGIFDRHSIRSRGKAACGLGDAPCPQRPWPQLVDGAFDHTVQLFAFAGGLGNSKFLLTDPNNIDA